jgi:hypothetical protein
LILINCQTVVPGGGGQVEDNFIGSSPGIEKLFSAGVCRMRRLSLRSIEYLGSDVTAYLGERKNTLKLSRKSVTSNATVFIDRFGRLKIVIIKTVGKFDDSVNSAVDAFVILISAELATHATHQNSHEL